MKSSSIIFIYLPLVLFIIGCSEKPDSQVQIIGQEQETNFLNWWKDYKQNVDLTTEFLPRGVAGEKISKEDFLVKLKSGDFIPVPLNDSLYYLYKLSPQADQEIKKALKSEMAGVYRNFKMEGKKIPAFSVRDVEGRKFSSSDLLGKTIVLKGWFLDCKPCIEEIPDLNKLTEMYTDESEIVFISFAMDPETEIKKFLEKRNFNYAIIPNKKEFLQDTLGLQVYPTHIIVNQKGIIEKVFNSGDKLISYLNNGSVPQEIKNIPPPPPPPM